MIFIRLFSADAPEVSPVRRCEQITVLQLRNVQSRAAVLKWLLTAGCKRWRRNEWRIFIINILLLWLQARILVFSGERILSPSPSLSPAPLSSLLFLHQTSFYLNSHSLWLHSRWVQRCFWPTKSSILSTNRSGCRPTPTVITVRHLPSLFPVTQQQDAGCESDVPADVFVFLKTEKQQKYWFTFAD